MQVNNPNLVTQDLFWLDNLMPADTKKKKNEEDKDGKDGDEEEEESKDKEDDNDNTSNKVELKINSDVSFPPIYS
jgi:hypothetical protein